MFDCSRDFLPVARDSLQFSVKQADTDGSLAMCTTVSFGHSISTAGKGAGCVSGCVCVADTHCYALCVVLPHVSTVCMCVCVDNSHASIYT